MPWTIDVPVAPAIGQAMSLTDPTGPGASLCSWTSVVNNGARAMGDPFEGVDAAGCIVTGVARRRVPASFEPLLAEAAQSVSSLAAAGSLYLYGSVATGRAEPGRSDVDLLTVDVPATESTALAMALSDRYRGLCRAVEIAATGRDDFAQSTDEGYGNRVFLRHYCVHIAGPVLPVERAFPADARAARGFNGDIAQHAGRWQEAVDSGADRRLLARQIARKTLLAVAGLVSVHDGTWTTDRQKAAERWGQVEPSLAAGLGLLADWVDGPSVVTRHALEQVLGGTVQPVVDGFAQTIGLWR